MGTEQMGKWLMIIAIILFIIGGVLFIWGKYVGHIPGDIVVKKGNFTLMFPIVTCLIISIVGTILLNLFFRH